MRVAYVCADRGVPVFGTKGCSIHVQEMLRGLRRHDAQVELFACRLVGPPPVDLADVRVHELPRSAGEAAAELEMSAMRLNGPIARMLDEHGPFDVVYERYSLWNHAGMDYARRHGIPGILEVNAPLIEEQATHRELIHRDVAEQVARRVFATASQLVAVSHGVARAIRKWTPAAKRVHVVHNGVDASRFAVPARVASDTADVFTIGFVGSLKPWHGVDVLLSAFDVLHALDCSYRLLIVGDGPQRGTLEQRMTGMNLVARRAVTFTGAVAPSEVAAHLASMDVAVAPYPHMDEFYFSPLKIYEYMAAGLPVVASDIGDIPSVLEDRFNGILVPAGNLDALVREIHVLRGDPHFRARLGAQARKTVWTHFTWDHVVERIFGTALERALC